MQETITTIQQLIYTSPDSIGVLVRLIDALKDEIRENFIHSGDSLIFCINSLTDAQKYPERNDEDRFRGIKFRAVNLIASFGEMVEKGLVVACKKAPRGNAGPVCYLI